MTVEWLDNVTVLAASLYCLQPELLGGGEKTPGAWYHFQDRLLNSVWPTAFINFHCNVYVKP